MSSWRPEGWYDLRLFLFGSMFEAKLYEDGADDMLQALRKNGWRVTAETLPTKANGTWVFIPDEEGGK